MTGPRRYDAVIVGSGPNGLAAAVALAKAGHSVKVVEGQATLGGGTRTLPLTLPGFAHDVCSAIHPLAAASPFFASLDLAKHGVEFIHSPHPLAHPLDGGRAVVLHRSIEETAEGLGRDAKKYLALVKPFVEHFEDLKPLLFNPLTKPPLRNPFLAARFGFHALRSAVDFALNEFETEEAHALFAGCAAHSFSPLTEAFTASFALALAVTGHAVGWPLIRGGSQRLADALAQVLEDNGGEVELNHPVTTFAELPPARLVLFDTHAEVMARVCTERELPRGYLTRLRERKRAPGVFKIDYALDGPMPWRNAEVARAATVHVGGTLDELRESEAAPEAGRVPTAPYVLCAQQSLFDPTRAPPGHHTFWAYCHVPNGNDDDLRPALEAQLERFAPGFSDRVLHRSIKRGGDFEKANQSQLGGDIAGGTLTGLHLLVRPTLRLPYTTPNERILICSGSAPPGPGVHGMCGYGAAEVAKKRLRSTSE